ncbi:ATP-dependent DNA helicase DinG [Virgibacillus halodenitrificans]|uniref:ATP-dependent DNA helicase DinG n=1 Tax=Virgibacillus halodenitrificans TaxID=1482 RepID=UPI0024C054EB|nr:ATP-dependent DNA helicase DinG [Virgibacillus halodenitrificans]WHX27331.1 ATP-dependent DNA helicase DinG [Virgibacillus halodenitrificans]
MNRYVVIDLETTGHSPTKDDRIIEVGIVILKKDKIVDQYSTLLNPHKKIPPFISNLTGISNEDVKDAPSFFEKAEEIIELFKESYLIAHNVPFDLGFLNTQLAINGFQQLKNPVLDTVELSRILFPQAPSYKLGQLAEYLGIYHDEPHRALSDAYVTGKVFLKLKEKLWSLPSETIEHLIRLEKKLKSDLYPLLLQRQKQLMYEEIVQKNIATYQGLAFKHIEVPQVEHGVEHVSCGDFLDSIYEENGALQNKLSSYEKRDGQREMSEVIFDAFQLQKHALIEAETGTGKSLAYLLPAVYEAVYSERKIVISTFTTQLQSQLLEEEIPLVRDIVNFPIQVALLKGKSHYLSLEKFNHELASPYEDNYDVVLTKAMLLIWITETETGDIEEIQLPTSGFHFFKKVSTESEGYIDPSSPWFSRSFYQKARKKAQLASIVITNHALLCTDIFNEYKLLPSYDKIIVDEAHHLEETASRHYGKKLDYISMQYILNQLGTTEETKFLGKFIEKYPYKQHHLSLEKWNATLSDAKYEIDELFRTLFQYVMAQNSKNKSLSDVGRIQYRFEDENEIPDKWKAIREMASRVSFYLKDLIHILTSIERDLLKEETFEKFDHDELKGNIDQLQSFIDRLAELFFNHHGEKYVKWMEIETHGAKNAVYLYSEPTDIADFLTNDFFTKKKSVILTSATLTMKQSFSFIQNRLGLPSDLVLTTKIKSPFSYKDQVKLMIPNDFPSIKYGKPDDFIYATCEAIMSLAEITNGRMLVLFTSYDMLRKSYYLLKEIMESDKYMVIAQGISSGSRARLKKNFQTFEQAILLGTSSFWEGVDIPGEDLSCLMIIRLPFQPPDHPIYEAKSEHLKNEGKNPFMELALPNAVIRFKQGFGRLIRSASDRGIVFVCDSRMITAKYGSYFRDSIPEVPITNDSTQKLMEQAKEWF